MASRRVIQRHFSTALELIECLSPSRGFGGLDYRSERWLYRGHGSERYELVPSAFRSYTLLPFDGEWLPAPLPTHRMQIGAEVELVRQFFSIADAQGLAIPEDSQTMRRILRDLHDLVGDERHNAAVLWPPPELWSLLAICQHHMLSTRLLDWTWNSYVAAYFAATDAVIRVRAMESAGKEILLRDENLAVIAMRTDIIEQRTAPGRKQGVYMVTVPTAGNPNLRAQRGVFLLQIPRPVHVDDYFDVVPYDKLALSRRSVAGDAPLLIKFTIPLIEADELLRLLAKENVTAASLFPGWDGVVRAMNESRYWPALTRWRDSEQGIAAGAYQSSLMRQDTPSERRDRRKARRHK